MKLVWEWIRKHYKGLLVFLAMSILCLLFLLYWFNHSAGWGPGIAGIDAWLGFIGAILGGVISGTITLYVLMVSRKEQQDANKQAARANDLLEKQMRNELMPIFVFNSGNIPNDEVNSYALFSFDLGMNDGQRSSYSFTLHNIGRACCTYLELSSADIMDSDALLYSGKPTLSSETEFYAVYCEPGKCINLSISMQNACRSFSFEGVLFFKDSLGRGYKQKFRYAVKETVFDKLHLDAPISQSD